MKIGYIRVSTKRQRPDRQINGLKGYCDKIYIEKLSAVASKRPIFEKVIRELKRGDILVVWDLDRAFRSTEDAIVHERELRSRGIKFKAMNMEIDTSTADGNQAFQIRAVSAEHERKKISERTIEGLKAARKRGSRLGRPPKMTKVQILVAEHKIAAKEASVSELAALYGVHPWTLTRSIRRLQSAV